MDPAQPGGDAPAPVTPPAGEPAAPVTPPAPAEPAAPVTPPAPTEPSAEEQAETQEWENAEKEIFPGIKTKQEPKKNEPEKPAEASKTPEAPAPGAEGDKPPATGEEGADENGEQDEDEGPEFDSAAYDARRAAREAQQDKTEVISDVRKQLYPDLPQQLQDADGDPINSIDDVMRLVNPRTGKPFTEEEAGQWLLAAQNQFNRRMSDIDKQVDQIADTYIDLKDQADSINYRYGELLKVLPDPRNPKQLLKDSLWARFQNTLVKDEKSGIILRAPVSLEDFYTTVLEPYAVMARQAEGNQNPADPANPAAPAETPEQKTAREAKEKQDAEDKKKRELADRSDIYGGGSKDDPDPEAKEWAQAENEVFGDELRRRNQKK